MTRYLAKKCLTCGFEESSAEIEQCPVCFGVTWKLQCTRHNIAAGPEGCKACAYVFLGEYYHTPATLAEALSGAWDAGIVHFTDQPLHEWIRETFEDKALSATLRRCYRSSKLNPEQKLAVSLMLLDSTRALVWRGDRVTPDWLLKHSNQVELLFEGEFPDWLNQLGKEEWLMTFHAHWLAFWDRAGTNADLFDRNVALQLLVGPSDNRRTSVSERRKVFSESTVPTIQRLFEKTALDEIDSVMLASCSLKCLRSRVEAQARIARAYRDCMYALLHNSIPKLTTLNGLKQCRLRFEAERESHRAELMRLSGSNVEIVVESSVVELEIKTAAALAGRFASHERQRVLRDRVLELATAGRICDAEALAGDWKTEFADLELGLFYHLRRRWRWLVNANRIAWGALVIVFVVAGAIKWTRMRSVKPFELPLAQGVSLHFLPLPIGAFDIGSSPSDKDSNSSERPVTTVRLTRQLWLTESEITQAQWQAVMATDVEQQRRKHKVEEQSVERGPALPIVFVSWSEAEVFCRKVAQRLPQGGMVRLPTEAEWEIACRAGANARLFPSNRLLPSAGNFRPIGGGASGQAMPVKQFPANGWGFYDLHGNVAEWCSGGAVRYPGGEVENWYAIETEGERAYRGGSWKLPIQLARASTRNWRPHGSPTAHVGFRVLFDPHTPPM